MKANRAIFLSLCALACAGFATAASAQSLTRADVRSELVRLEQAGYNPNTNGDNYPEDVQAAEAKVAARDAQSAVGGVSMSGRRSVRATVGIPSTNGPTIIRSKS